MRWRGRRAHATVVYGGAMTALQERLPSWQAGHDGVCACTPKWSERATSEIGNTTPIQ